MSKAIKIMFTVVSILLLLPSGIFAEDIQNQAVSFSTSDNTQKNQISRKYENNYWSTVALTLVFTAIPIAMFVGTIFLVHKKRKSLQKVVGETNKFCSACNHKVNKHALYCEMCGVNLATGKKDLTLTDICPLCKIPMKEHSHLCVRCGISLH